MQTPGLHHHSSSQVSKAAAGDAPPSCPMTTSVPSTSIEPQWDQRCVRGTEELVNRVGDGSVLMLGGSPWGR